jgi:hypothetical protein
MVDYGLGRGSWARFRRVKRVEEHAVETGQGFGAELTSFKDEVVGQNQSSLVGAFQIIRRAGLSMHKKVGTMR